VYRVKEKMEHNDVYLIEKEDGTAQRWVNREELKICHKPSVDTAVGMPAAQQSEGDHSSSEDDFLIEQEYRERMEPASEEDRPHSDQDEDSDDTDIPVLRRTARATAGVHNNPEHWPRSTVKMVNASREPMVGEVGLIDGVLDLAVDGIIG
jgi:hypothetical protein